MSTTLQQVATRAGVSLATASRVLNGSSRRPTPDMVQRVKQAAKDLGYVANAQAQALARASTRMVGLIVHDIADPYFSSIAAGVQAVCAERERLLLLASTGRVTGAQLAAVAAFMRQRTEAIILAGSRLAGDPELVAELIRQGERYEDNGGRITVIGQELGSFRAVRPDNAGGAAALARQLIDAGHQRFAVVAGPDGLQTSDERCAAFADVVRRSRRASLEWTVRGEFTRDGGYRAGLEGLGATEGELCVFAATDVMALGVMSAARELGLSVPHQIAVCGFDDIPTLRDVTPALTTVRLDLEGMGRAAGALSIDPEADVADQFPAVPILRASTARP